MDARRHLTLGGLCLALALPETASAATKATVPAAEAARPASGRPAIAEANQQARARSEPRRFRGGVQRFAFAPGRIYEVWTAPLRVTAISLAPEEAVLSLAAGDTVRWQIGETASGEGPGRRAHVLVKPMAQGLETNLLVATSQRLYVLHLRSGGAEAFNAAVEWDLPPPSQPPPANAPPPTPSPLITLPERLDAAYRIQPRGRRPSWTPTAVMTDGRRTFIAFPASLTAGEAPALFGFGPDGKPELVNYRQQDRLYIADRVLEAAELRLGGRRPRVVRISRLPGPRP